MESCPEQKDIPKKRESEQFVGSRRSLRRGSESSAFDEFKSGLVPHSRTLIADLWWGAFCLWENRAPQESRTLRF